MRKTIFPVLGMIFLCSYTMGQEVQYKITHAGNTITFTPEQVSSDFGPRLLPGYDWHGGIDYNRRGGGQIK